MVLSTQPWPDVPQPRNAREWVRAHEACERLGVGNSTLYSWVSRYSVRKVIVPIPHVGTRSYYDYSDLAVIERELRHRHPVPATPELRARVRHVCPLAQALGV